MKNWCLILILFSSLTMQSQKIKKVEPPYWWVGMQHQKVQLMIYGDKISAYSASVEDKEIKITEAEQTNNPNYLFLTLDFSAVKQARDFKIIFSKPGEENLIHTYTLKSREPMSAQRQGFKSSDVIYLITPDRFANGDTSNDINKELNEKTIDRKDNYARHGGDIKGITDHLNYIGDMGFTAIWPSPMLSNNMPGQSYHGYAITDLYEVDPRFGTMDEYKTLSKEAKKREIKLIMDMVANHIGSEHWWMKDLPSEDWVNFQKEFLKDSLVVTNHRRTTNQDPYASEKDKKSMSDGWFVPSMPDLNQKNPFLATYLIQNSIWWIETLDLGGIRQDTYPYPDKYFMAEWAGAIMNEYPNFSIVGEEWSYNPLLVGYWQRGAQNKDGYDSNMTSSMDFPMQKMIVEGLKEAEAWDKGFVKLYEGLANDFYYSNPKDIMIFLDNHDMDRVFTQLNHNVTQNKMALAYMLLLPRIPQIYYGTEILMENSKKPGDHGLIRTDFPGGWAGDAVNAFTGIGLNAEQKEMQSFLKKLLQYRKNSEAIHAGKTIHFAPDKNVYALARKLNDEIVLVILNKNNKPFRVDLNKFEELGIKGKKIKNMISGEVFDLGKTLELKDEGVILLTTKIN